VYQGGSIGLGYGSRADDGVAGGPAHQNPMLTRRRQMRKRMIRMLAVAMIASPLLGVLVHVEPAAAMKCWQPGGHGTPYICSAG
jgi:hypothetical protein